MIRLAFKQATGTSYIQAEFYINLAEQLIDNDYDNNRREPRYSNSGEEAHRANLRDEIDDLPRSGVSAHLTPTTQKRRKHNGELVTNHAKQGYCNICGMKSKYHCSQCLDEKAPGDKDIWLCHGETGRNCFIEHMSKCHCE